MNDEGVVELGDEVQDRITGFRGVVTGLARYISGCSQGLVAPKLAADQAFRESQWLDVQRLEVQTKQAVTLNNGDTPGADRPAPKR